MKAKLIYKAKSVDENQFILEMVIWQLPKTTPERPHGIKYRLFYGDPEGTCLVRYDNETGKGDHKHLGESEFPYRFISVEKLVSDFFADIDRINISGGTYEH